MRSNLLDLLCAGREQALLVSSEVPSPTPRTALGRMHAYRSPPDDRLLSGRQTRDGEDSTGPEAVFEQMRAQSGLS